MSPEWAAQEFLRRQRARHSLIEFSQSIQIPGVPLIDAADEEDPRTGRLAQPLEVEPVVYQPVETRIAIHHKVMMQAIQRCIETPRGRLMIMAPPGAAKSTYVSVVASAWAMGRKPNTQVLLASYASAIAAKQSRKVRSIVRDPRYTAIWPSAPKLTDDQRAIDDWSLTNGSSFHAAGLLAGITGLRADLLLIDDPTANREQADSVVTQEKIYSEYLDTAMTRAKPWMSSILVSTRWSESDLLGEILPADYEGESGPIRCRDGQLWEVLCIQAECERADDPCGRAIGDFLWSEFWPREHWAIWRDSPRAARTWSALFQQRPAPSSGVHFSRELFHYYEANAARSDDRDSQALPVSLKYYLAVDWATMEAEPGKREPDYSEIGVWGMDHRGDLWAVDWFYRQCETDEGIKALIRLIGLYHPLRCFHEGGLIDKAIGPAIRDQMRRTQRYVSMESLSSIEDKSMKVQAFHARATAKTIHFPLRSKWADHVIDQLCRFPGAKHDDAVDVCGLLGRGVDKMHDANLPFVEPKPMLIPFSPQWLEYKDSTDKPRQRFFS